MRAGLDGARPPEASYDVENRIRLNAATHRPIPIAQFTKWLQLRRIDSINFGLPGSPSRNSGAIAKRMTRDELKSEIIKRCALVRQQWRRFAICPSHLDDPNYKLSEEWLREFKPSSSVEGYDKGLDYAWRRFDEVTAASETLDKKADNVMRNAGLLAGLLGLAINTVHVNYPRFLIPSLIAFVASLILAAIACNPTGGATTASVQDLLDDITSGHANDAWIAASISCAVVGRSATNNWKAQRIRWATYLFCGGLILFAVPVILTWLL